MTKQLGEAQRKLGMKYIEGTGGVAKNEANAVDCFMQGAESWRLRTVQEREHSRRA